MSLFIENFFLILKNVVDFFLKQTKVKDLFNFLKEFFINLKSKFTVLTSKNIYILSDYSIIIENSNFSQALKQALNYFKVMKKENIVWKKVYYDVPNKDMTIDAFKFVYMLDINKLIDYLTDDNEDYNNYMNINSLVRRDGVYLKLFSDLQNKESTIKLIEYKLKKMECTPDQEIIEKIYSNKREWIKVGERIPNPKLDGKLYLKISNDKCKVYAVKTPSKAGGKDIDEIDVNSSLEEKQIIYGIDKKAISNFVNSSVFNEKFLIVKAKEAVNMGGTKFEEVYKETYKKIMKGRKGSQYLKPFYSVKKDEMILKKVRSNKVAEVGINIYGNEVQPIIEQDAVIQTGDNTYLDEEGNLRASISGGIVEKEGVFYIYPQLELKTVNMETGDINHPGHVRVSGDVEDGFDIVASGIIEIGGTVGASYIEADGDIVVKIGVSGKNKAVIKSNHGSIHAKYIQNATVTAKVNVISDDLISSSKIYAGNEIIVESKKGFIWGGELYALSAITTGNLGSLSGWKTSLNLGVPLDILNAIRETKEKITQLKNQNISAKRALLNENLKTDDRIKQNDEIQKIEKKILMEIESLRRLMEESEEIYQDALVKVYSKIYPGVVVKINSLFFENRLQRNGVMFGIFQGNKKFIQMRKI